jgi:ribonuclease D
MSSETTSEIATGTTGGATEPGNGSEPGSADAGNPVLEAVRFSLITDSTTLAESCRHWATCEALALDTEFMRVSTFYPRVALIQIADGSNITLIDPLPIQDWEPFRQLMSDPAITKVFHSCSEDLLVFFTFLDLLPRPVFDTQIASALLNEGVGLSYQNLVKQRFGIDLPKAETRSDWLQRPLTPEQLEYAALDVAYLHQTWHAQRLALRALGRESWLQEECVRQQQQYACEFSGDFADYYLNFKAAWQLHPRQLAALKKLATWREQRARKRDKPRSWIIKDTALFALALGLHTDKSQLAAVEEVSDNFIRHEGDQVLALLSEARQMEEADCPLPLPRPLTQGQKTRLREAQDLVAAMSAELGIVPELLGRKRTLLALQYAVLAIAVDPQLPLAVPDELQGWRGPLLLDALITVFSA